MPAQTGSDMLFASMPSFRSIFKEKPTVPDHKDTPEDGPPTLNTARRTPGSFAEAQSRKQLSDRSFAALHQYRGSVSTSASDSTNSSPTTTFSTTDSSVMTEPSPGTSPESPGSRHKEASSYPSDGPKDSMPSNGVSAPLFELQRPATPSKKLRNLKNLAVNTSNSQLLNRAVTTAAITTVSKADSTISTPPSPVFMKPLTPPRRRPSNLGLTITTPTIPTKVPTYAGPTEPPTPGLRRPNALRHFQSSPSLPLRSPASSDGSEVSSNMGGFGCGRPPTRGFSEIPQETEEDEEMNFDVPQSREEKPASYPNGPICIYESGVFLYFEPTAEQAADYDVIFNVASEVKNPFAAQTTIINSQPTKLLNSVTAFRGKSQIDRPKEQQALGISNAKSPAESAVNKLSKEPEYIHIPWEHNTDIVPDLYRLVKLIDERVQCGKRILVHCQCGVSRSASLIVAYGLYKNPQMSVQEAYDAVKKRSKWIGPNMNLIMQLQEFRSELLRNANEGRGNSNSSNGFVNFFSHKKNLKSESSAKLSSDGRPSLDSGYYRSEPESPRTAPLPSSSDLEDESIRADIPAPASAGPSSAPLSSTWVSGLRRSWAASPLESGMTLPTPTSADSGSMQYVDPKGQMVENLSRTGNHAGSGRHGWESRREQDQSTVSDEERTISKNVASTVKDQTNSQPPSVPEVASMSLSSPITESFPMPFPLPEQERKHRGAGIPVLRTSTSASHDISTTTRAITSISSSTSGILSPQTSKFPSLPFGFARARAEAQPQRQTMKAAPIPRISIKKNRNQKLGNQDALSPSHNSDVNDNDGACLSPSMLDSLALESPRESQAMLKAPKKHAGLRPKYSSPGLHEQMQLRRFQDEMEASLAANRSPRLAPSSRNSRVDTGNGGDSALGLGIGNHANSDSDEILMSPRATEFANNPFHQILVPLSSTTSSLTPGPSFTSAVPPLPSIGATRSTGDAVAGKLSSNSQTSSMAGMSPPEPAPPSISLPSLAKPLSSSSSSLSIITPTSKSSSSSTANYVKDHTNNDNNKYLHNNFNNLNLNQNNINEQNNKTIGTASTPEVGATDPRSPVQKGLSPIVRNIWDVL